MYDLGKILKNLREEKNVSMDKMIEDIKLLYNISIAKSTISKWENNKADPSLENARILCKYFNVTLDYLLGVENANSSLKKEEKISLSKIEENHIYDLRKLNDLGQNKVITYTKDLIDNPKFINEPIQKQSEDEISSTSIDDFEPYLFAAHNDGIDEETNKANIEKIKKMYLEIKGK